MAKLFLNNYNSFTEFTNGVSIVSESLPGFDKVYHLVDSLNNPTSSYYLEVGDFSDGLLRVKDENNKWGFINSSGEEVISCKFDEVGDFNGGFARCRVGEKWGYINNQGQFAIQPRFDDAFDFKNGFACVKQGNTYGALNQKMELLKCNFISSSPIEFVNNVAKISYNGLFGFIDENGNIVIPCIHSEVGSFENSDFAPVKYNGKWGYAHKFVNNSENGTFSPYIDYQYANASNFHEGLAWLILSSVDKCSYISEDGTITPLLKGFSVAADFSEGLASVMDSSRRAYGYIDKSGNMVIEPKYSVASSFKGGFAVVYNNESKCGIIDKKGKEIIPCKYDEIRPFVQGMAAARKEDLWGFVNTEGEEVIPCKYLSVSDFDEGFSVVQITDNGDNLVDNRYIDFENNVYTYKQRNLIKALLYQVKLAKDMGLPESEINELKADFNKQMLELKETEDKSQNEGLVVPETKSNPLFPSSKVSKNAALDELVRMQEQYRI